MTMAQANWRDQHKGEPDTNMPWKPNDPASYRQYVINENQKESDRGTASAELVGKNDTALTLKSDLEELKDFPGLKKILTIPGM